MTLKAMTITYVFISVKIRPNRFPNQFKSKNIKTLNIKYKGIEIKQHS